MGTTNEDEKLSQDRFQQEVASRFGILPNFFCTAEDVPGLIQELWSFAKSAYLDNPLPSLFKERLFVHLSRFCEVRYCVIRHVGFLIGFGNASGDAAVEPHSVRQALALLSRRVPTPPEMQAVILRLERYSGHGTAPERETQLEWDLFDALTLVFLKPVGADRARLAIRHCMGGAAFEYVMALLAFIRTAHYWTETHPELSCEQDMVRLMKEHPDLGRLLMNDPEAEAATLKSQIKEAVAESQRRSAELAAIVDSSSDAIISENLDGIITSWNNAGCRIFGYTAEEIIGKSILTLVPEHLRDEETKMIEGVRAGQHIEYYETLRVAKDGRLFDVSLSISPIRDETGQVTGSAKVLRDISVRKRMEQSLLQAEKIAATGRMAATIAHEINNPLEAITNLLYLLRSKLTDDEARERLATAEEELGRVAHIARQTLGYYRENASPSEVSLSKIAQHAVTIYRPRCASAGIELHASFKSSREAAFRRGEIMQVISNLIANALYAMPNGGQLSISVEDVDTPVDGMELVIRDTGMGIAKQDLAKVFDAFFTTRATIGTGIGLFIAKQFVEGHGGAIGITSETDAVRHGTTVRVFLPLHTPYENSTETAS